MSIGILLMFIGFFLMPNASEKPVLGIISILIYCFGMLCITFREEKLMDDISILKKALKEREENKND